jgi:hypothetical protein
MTITIAFGVDTTSMTVVATSTSSSWPRNAAMVRSLSADVMRPWSSRHGGRRAAAEAPYVCSRIDLSVSLSSMSGP